MAKVTNPRFPHTCKIYRKVGETSFHDATEEITLYEGKCHKYGSSNLRTFKSNDVIKGDYAVDIPGLVRGIRGGDILDFEDYSESVEGILISDCYASEMGTTVYLNLSKN